ncbi:hypothetical protein CFREI_00195 [Corynebacterium freiburgense]|nr:hypothetical protein CFREI_00195 [Corynebacterium freiburgense]
MKQKAIIATLQVLLTVGICVWLWEYAQTLW